MPEGYCVKERKKVEIKDAKQVTMKNGRPAIQGVPRLRHEDLQDRQTLIGTSEAAASRRRRPPAPGAVASLDRTGRLNLTRRAARKPGVDLTVQRFGNPA